MKKSKVFYMGIIFQKILSLITILFLIIVIPYKVNSYPVSREDILGIVLIGFIFIVPLIVFFSFYLLRTNDPNRRFNIFTLNYNWKSRMDVPFSEGPGQIFTLDPKDPNIIKSENRDKKIKSILDI